MFINRPKPRKRDIMIPLCHSCMSENVWHLSFNLCSYQTSQWIKTWKTSVFCSGDGWTKAIAVLYHRFYKMICEKVLKNIILLTIKSEIWTQHFHHRLQLNWFYIIMKIFFITNMSNLTVPLNNHTTGQVRGSHAINGTWDSRKRKFSRHHDGLWSKSEASRPKLNKIFSIKIFLPCCIKLKL